MFNVFLFISDENMSINCFPAFFDSRNGVAEKPKIETMKSLFPYFFRFAYEINFEPTFLQYVYLNP